MQWIGQIDAGGLDPTSTFQATRGSGVLIAEPEPPSLTSPFCGSWRTFRALSITACGVLLLVASSARGQDVTAFPDYPILVTMEYSLELAHPINGLSNVPFPPVSYLPPPWFVGQACVERAQKEEMICVPGRILEVRMTGVETKGLGGPPRIESAPQEIEFAERCRRVMLEAYPNHGNPITPGQSDYPCTSWAFVRAHLTIFYEMCVNPLSNGIKPCGGTGGGPHQ